MDKWNDIPRYIPRQEDPSSLYETPMTFKRRDVFLHTNDEEIVSAEQTEIHAGSEENPVIFRKQRLESLRNGVTPIVRERENRPKDCYGRTYQNPYDVAVCTGCSNNMTKADISERCPKCKKLVCAACSGTQHEGCVIEGVGVGAFVFIVFVLVAMGNGCGS